MACFEKSNDLVTTTSTPIAFPIFPESDNSYAVTGFSVTFQDLALVTYRQGIRVSFLDLCTCTDTGIPDTAIDPPIPTDFYGRKFYAVNLIMYRGDSKNFAFQVIDQRTKAAIDVSGWSFKFMAKWEYTDANASAVITKTNPITNGINPTNPVSGQLTVIIQPADTTGLRPSSTEPIIPFGQKTDLYYDLQGIDLSGNIWTLASGKLTILPEVTQGT